MGDPYGSVVGGVSGRTAGITGIGGFSAVPENPHVGPQPPGGPYQAPISFKNVELIRIIGDLKKKDT